MWYNSKTPAVEAGASSHENTGGIQMTSKNCSKCGETKPLSEFPPQKEGRGGVRPDCRNCKNK